MNNRERKGETHRERDRERERQRDDKRGGERERKNSSLAQVELVHLRGFVKSETINCSVMARVLNCGGSWEESSRVNLIKCMF